MSHGLIFGVLYGAILYIIIGSANDGSVGGVMLGIALGTLITVFAIDDWKYR